MNFIGATTQNTYCDPASPGFPSILICLRPGRNFAARPAKFIAKLIWVWFRNDLGMIQELFRNDFGNDSGMIYNGMRRIFLLLYQNFVYNTSTLYLQKWPFCEVIQLKMISGMRHIFSVLISQGSLQIIYVLQTKNDRSVMSFDWKKKRTVSGMRRTFFYFISESCLPYSMLHQQKWPICDLI